MEAIWHTLKGKFSITSGDEFERLVLHYLRILWPTMNQSPRLQHLDRFGVDLCVPGKEDGFFDVVVQVKGFKADEKLLESQVKNQIIPSIKKFQSSPLKCYRYILLHNRDGSDRKLAYDIENCLNELVTGGSAKEAQLIDRDNFISMIREGINTLFREKLNKRSILLQKEQESFFHFGNLFVQQVPVARHQWRPDLSIRPEFTDTNFTDADVVDLISSRSKVRYAILIGSFGIGKTTMALRSAIARDHSVIYIRAYTVHNNYMGGRGTNVLMRNLNEELELLEDFPPDTAETLNVLVGPALGRILRQNHSEYVLILDGLDENNFYSTPQGLQLLTNELAELKCPIVLTTRKEHFVTLMGNYELAIEKLSKKGGARRSIDVMELGSWTSRQAKSLLQSAISNASTVKQKNKIQQLYDRLNSNAQGLFLDLLKHPLFLQMTLDLIVDGVDEWIEQKHILIEMWITKKIRRDFLVPRFDPRLINDVDAYVINMINAMTAIAREMVSQDGDTKLLLDSIPAENALKIVRHHVGVPDLDIATMLNSSLLVPVNRRHGTVLNVKFFHRAIQEYLLERESEI